MSDVGKGAVIVFGAPVRRFPDYLITVAAAPRNIEMSEHLPIDGHTP